MSSSYHDFDPDRPQGLLRSLVANCSSNLYGGEYFTNLQTLGTHLEESQPTWNFGSVTGAKLRKTTNSANSLSSSTAPTNVQTIDIGPFIHVTFDSSTGKRRNVHQTAAPRKRWKVSEEAKQNIKAVKESVGGPCLRCRILKKQCDIGSPCKNCPAQDDNAGMNFWKVLGCHRIDISQRNWELCITYTTAKGLAETFAKLMSLGEPDLGYLRRRYNTASWPKTRHEGLKFRWLLKIVSRKIRNMNVLASQEATIAKLNVERRYWKETLSKIAYHGKLWNSYQLWNGIRLERVEQLSVRTKQPSYLNPDYDGVESLTVVGWLLRHQSSCTGCTLSRLRLQASKSDCCDLWQTLSYTISEFLTNLLLMDGKYLSRAGGWLNTFITIIWFSAIKSALVDALTTTSDDYTPDKISHLVAKINSVYMVVVSLFAWFIKIDMLILSVEKFESYLTEHQNDSYDSKEDYLIYWMCIKEAVQFERWESRGIKSSKDYLMSLVSGFHNDGTYKGFYIQQYGLEEYRRAHLKRYGTTPIFPTEIEVDNLPDDASMTGGDTDDESEPD